MLSVISFKHNELTKQSAKKLKRVSFINSVNYAHFTGSQLFAHMIYTLTNEEFLVKVFPEPCDGSEITCRLPEGFSYNLENLEMKNLIIDDGKSISLMPIKILRMSKSFFTAKIKENGRIFGERQGKRFRCRLVTAKVSQEGIKTSGRLDDFNPYGLRLELKDHGDGLPYKFDQAKPVNIGLYWDNTCVFSGECKYIRKEEENRSIILEPLNIKQSIYKGRKSRTPRLSLIPTPKIIFNHPFNNKRATYEISDITTSGFSVREKTDRALLMPGMIIQEARILFPGGFKLKCSIQVIYGLKQKKNIKQFGFAIIDMDMLTYSQFFDILSNAHDVHANYSRDIDMDALWEFLFESGFIYSKKYGCLSQYKDVFKQTYEKLYSNSPEIFGNFTYQENGMIYGHVSMVKAYQRTWMIHHLAAKPLGRKKTGLYVLNHVLNYFDGLYRLPSIGMDHMIFYFRPNNKFPDYFFGGFCRELNNPKACSMDTFAYCTSSTTQIEALPAHWDVDVCSREDIDDLKAWYEKASGGLMMDAFCLKEKRLDEKSIEEMYSQAGLKRKSSTYCLRHGGQTKAFLIVDQSDRGVNLSDLLNCIKIIITDDEGLSWELLHSALCSVAHVYETETVPVIVYPYTYMDAVGVEYEKKYNLWVLNSRYGDEYAEHLKQKAKINITRFLIKYVTTKLFGKITSRLKLS
jgi:hypothetical protein